MKKTSEGMNAKTPATTTARLAPTAMARQVWNTSHTWRADSRALAR